MEIHTGLDSLPDERMRSGVVTWGVFDGVHLGHRRLLAQLVSWARERNLRSVAITFDRHPAAVLRGESVGLVSTLSQRLSEMARSGLHHTVLLSFTPEFAGMTAETFLQNVILERIGAGAVLLGHDSRFGKGRGGDADFLQREGRRLGLEVRTAEPEWMDGEPISSTRIRGAIQEGCLNVASKMLGRPVALRGTAVRGNHRGTELGFPTANMELYHRVYPPRGVYLVETRVGENPFLGVANLGVRPTFEEGVTNPSLEVHLLDYDGGDLYGEDLEVRFVRKIRDEKRFDGVEALKRQIARDVEEARREIARRSANEESF